MIWSATQPSLIELQKVCQDEFLRCTQQQADTKTNNVCAAKSQLFAFAFSLSRSFATFQQLLFSEKSGVLCCSRVLTTCFYETSHKGIWSYFSSKFAIHVSPFQLLCNHVGAAKENFCTAQQLLACPQVQMTRVSSVLTCKTRFLRG